MIRFGISKFPAFLLVRHQTFFQQVIRRKLTTTPLLFQKKKEQNSSNLEKKTESKLRPFQEAKRKIYHKFLCKCEAGFNNFSEFLEHLKTSHQIKNLNFPEIFAKKNGFERGIKFYWHLTCQCGNKFSSSLCNADLKLNKEQIEISKKYRLQCLKCKKYAKFDNGELLDEFLKERFKQKLIYNFYKKKFAKFEHERDSEKVLKGHKEALCEKCKLLGRYCGEELDNQLIARIEIPLKNSTKKP